MQEQQQQHNLHLRLTSIQAPNHDPMLADIASYLTSYFEQHGEKLKIDRGSSSSSSTLKVTFEFPICERNTFVIDRREQPSLKTKNNDHEQAEKTVSPSSTEESTSSTSSSSSSTPLACQIDVVGTLSGNNNSNKNKKNKSSSSQMCSCGAPYLSWMHRAKLLEDGDAIQFGWFCGLPYVLGQDGYSNGIYSSKRYLRNYPEAEITTGEKSSSPSSIMQTSNVAVVAGCSGQAVQIPVENKHNHKTTPAATMPAAIYTKQTPFLESNGNRKWIPLVAPRMASSRYQSVPFPCYFSDVIVRKSSDTQHLNKFDDLIGKAANIRWGFNEPHSQSGFNVTRDFLWRRMMMIRKMRQQQGQENINERKNSKNDEDDEETNTTGMMINRDEFDFAHVGRIGSHQESIQKVISGEIDAAAIDSTVLETELEKEPLLLHKIKIVHVLGPSPSPLFAMNRDGLVKAIKKQLLPFEDDGDDEAHHHETLAEKICDLIKEALVSSSSSQSSSSSTLLQDQKKRILKKFNLASFDQVCDADYNCVREMLEHSLDFPQW